MQWTDEFLGYLELEKSLYFSYIPQKEQLPYVVSALQIGRRVAQEAQGLSISELCQLHDIQIIPVKTESAVAQQRIVRAEFEYDKRAGTQKIFLYTAALEELVSDTNLTRQQVEELLLSHEWFHFWETQHGFVYQQLPQLEVPGLFGRKKTVAVRPLSEIAAHAFAKEMISLPQLPLIYDIQKQIKEGWLSQGEVEAAYKRFLPKMG